MQDQNLHAFFFGKAVDIAIAERSTSSLHEMTDTGEFYEYIASIARCLHSKFEISEIERYQTKLLIQEKNNEA